MKKLFAALATVSMLGLAPAAFAAEPVQLTDTQMDSVTAGSIGGAVVNLKAFALGVHASATETTGFAVIHQTRLPYGLIFGGVAAGGSSVSSN